MKWLSDALCIAGALSITAGCGLWSIELGFIVGGVFMLAAGVALAYIRYGQKARPNAP
jgi:hypothetical protein